MISDNGSQFIGAERQLKEMIKGWDIEKLREFSAEKGIQWKFTTPASPHQNGCAEALVKSCKMALKKAIGEQMLAPFSCIRACWKWRTSLINDQLGAFQTTLMMDHTFVRMTYCLDDHRLTCHKAHSEKPRIHVSELNLFRRLWTRFGSGGQGMYFRR